MPGPGHTSHQPHSSHPLPPLSCCLMFQRAVPTLAWSGAGCGQGDSGGCRQWALPWDAVGKPQEELEHGWRGRDEHSAAQGEAPGCKKVTGPAQHNPAPLCQRAGAATPLQLPGQLSSHTGPVQNWPCSTARLGLAPRPCTAQDAKASRDRERQDPKAQPWLSHNSCPRHSPSGFPQMPYANWFFYISNRSLDFGHLLHGGTFVSTWGS